MREAQWIEWTRTRLPPPEREALSTSEQRAHLDSEGSARELTDRDGAKPAKAA